MICLLVFVFSNINGQQKSWYAGKSQVNITPKEGDYTLSGFRRDSETSLGVLDSLYAKILYLEFADKNLAIVTVDLVESFGDLATSFLKKEVLKRTGVEHIIVNASHTHSSPEILEHYPNNEVPKWEKAIIIEISKAIEKAKSNKRKALINAGKGYANVGHNRRKVNEDGSVTMIWSNPERFPTSPVDSIVTVLRVDDSKTMKPMVILGNYACHAVVFGEKNYKLSADFPGYVAKHVEQEIGDDVMFMFLQGAAGDIDPFLTNRQTLKEGLEHCKEIGEVLGTEIVKVSKNIKPSENFVPSLQVEEKTISVPSRFPPEKLIAMYKEQYKRQFGEEIDPSKININTGPTYGIPITTALINGEIALMTMPAEPFVEFQIDWRNRLPVKHTFFLGYTNGYVGYIPTIRAAAEGGYGANDATVWVNFGVGEMLVDKAVIDIYRFLGKF